ncbi:hypothetical protein P43SY_010507 [Pythium insidiosum]|uniref:Amino acid transporter transmembrane domain-containing protein n=1 Tax=Pythium insidiosum TaxID=114742 RepID=A0AAD5Q2C9_PYTIN|nr:hypothetical protein P43SY_010507 [Pythium insidiosum]
MPRQRQYPSPPSQSQPQPQAQAQQLLAVPLPLHDAAAGSVRDSKAQLQSAYDSYAENIHAISIRHGSYGAIGSHSGSSSALHGHGRRRRRLSSQTAADQRLSLWQTSFHLISFMAGSGLVCLPLALVEINWYGLLLLVVAAAVCIYTSRLLIEAMDIVRWSTGRSVKFSDLSRECFGRIGAVATSVVVHGSFLWSATGYLALACSCLSGVTGVAYGRVVLVLGSCLWGHVLLKSLKALAVFSAVNVALSFWIEAIIFGDAMYPLKQIALEEPAFLFITPDLSSSSLTLKLAYSFTLLSSGFFCHSIIPTLYHAMEDHRQCSTVVTRSQTAVLTMLYLPICGITYAVYGATLQAPVFFNMRNAVVRNLAIVLYCVHLLLSYTIAIFPLYQTLERWISRKTAAAVEGRLPGGVLQTPPPSRRGINEPRQRWRRSAPWSFL